MKESLFIKLVKYLYGINKPFDEFTKKVIYEAANKVAFGLIIFLFVSIFLSLGIVNLYATPNIDNIAIGMIFADGIAVLIALTYIEIVVKRFGLGEYDYSNESERKKAVRSYIVRNIITLILIVILIIYVDLCLHGDSSVIVFVVYAILFVVSRYLDYRRKFK